MSKDIQLFWRIILLKIGMLLHWNTFKKKKNKKNIRATFKKLFVLRRDR